jgi:flagellum-specific ATP synthase
MEGDDQQEPIVDAARSFLDGHIFLSRDLAAEGWYPPIQILDSVSRLMPAIITDEHKKAAALMRRMLAVYARSEDLIRIGAYKPGADRDLDRAIQSRPLLREFLVQQAHEDVRFDQASRAIEMLAARV